MAGATGGHTPFADQDFLLSLRSNAEGMTRPDHLAESAELTNDSLPKEPKLQKRPQ